MHTLEILRYSLNSHRLCGVVIALGFLTGPGASPLPGEVAAYFDDRVFCSVARVRSVGADARGAVVALDIDPRWQSTLSGKPLVRQRWFAIHCPPAGHPLWEALGSGEDILVTGQLGDGRVFELGCRDFHAQQRRDRQAAQSGRDAWLKRIRQRLGLLPTPGEEGR